VPIGFVSVSLSDSRGRLVIAEHAGTGHKLMRFTLLVPGSGRYTLQATMNGGQARRTVELRVHRVLHANIIYSIY
jgi:hypothetical protein